MFSTTDQIALSTAKEVLEYVIDQGWTSRKEIGAVLKLGKTTVNAWFEHAKRRPSSEQMSLLHRDHPHVRVRQAIADWFFAGSNVIAVQAEMETLDENGDGVVNLHDVVCKLLASADQLTTELHKQYKAANKPGTAATSGQAIDSRATIRSVVRKLLSADRIIQEEFEKSIRRGGAR